MFKIDGKKIAADLRQELKKKINDLKAKYHGVPGLTVILIGEDPPSKIYVKNKEKFAKEVGMNSEVIRYPADLQENELLNKIKELNKNDKVSGILVQLPLPKHINKRKVIETIDHTKDVDGFHPVNVGNLSLFTNGSYKLTLYFNFNKFLHTSKALEFLVSGQFSLNVNPNIKIFFPLIFLFFITLW